MKKQKQIPKQIYINRLKCGCVAQKHELINNCTGCGKVVCAQQGQGQCLECGKIVTRPETTLIISSSDKSMFPSLSTQQFLKVSQQRSMAILHKNKLVQRDRSTNISQNIIDQQMDFYDVSQNQWLDESDRQKAIERILQKDRFVEAQQFKTRVMLNPLTGEFERQQFTYDEEQFRKQGRDFISQKERDDFNNRMRKTQTHFDDRILKNQKMKDICHQILHKQRKIPDKFLERKAALQRKVNQSQLIIEQQTQVEPN